MAKFEPGALLTALGLAGEFNARAEASWHALKDTPQAMEKVWRVWPQALEAWGGDEIEAADFLCRPHLLLRDKSPLEVILTDPQGDQIINGLIGRMVYGSAA